MKSVNTTGFISKFDIYAGKNTKISKIDKEVELGKNCAKSYERVYRQTMFGCLFHFCFIDEETS